MLLKKVGMVAGLLLSAGALQAQQMQMQMPEGKDVRIQGTVVDISCKFGQGLSGEGHKMCSEVCADKGLPLAILGDDGVLYIPTTAAMPGENQNGKLRAFAEQRVTVTGKSFAAGGSQALQIATVRKS